MNAAMDMATRIRVARQRTGMTQRELAARMHVTRNAVANWELNARPNPSLSHLVRLATTLSISLEWLATGRGEMVIASE
jgi:transcriptional regulator with XRE-family HTH domain